IPPPPRGRDQPGGDERRYLEQRRGRRDRAGTAGRGETSFPHTGRPGTETGGPLLLCRSAKRSDQGGQNLAEPRRRRDPRRRQDRGPLQDPPGDRGDLRLPVRKGRGETAGAIPLTKGFLWEALPRYPDRAASGRRSSPRARPTSAARRRESKAGSFI